ncbi:MAG: disulfide bond formation protein B [Alphaproteobacteria bacterium]|nr:MAG: disulfide bond formation protein B [Alphaproteobacteria bacterium]
MNSRLGLARLVALLVPLGLLAGAFGSQYWGGLYPCEMCWWQRYAHIAALPFAALAFMAGPERERALVLAALAIATSGAIAFYHAGVELGYFEGFTQCTSTGAGGSAEDLLKAVFAAPMIRCDEIQWSFLGISMAGWNAILSLSSALLILWLTLARPRKA